MRLLLVFLPFMFFLIQGSIAQSVTLSADFGLELGEPYNVLDASYKRYFFPIKEERAVSVKRVKERMIVQIFDTKNLKELARNDYREFPDLSTLTQSYEESFIHVKEKLYHVLYVYDSKTKAKKMQVRTINTENGDVSSPRTLFVAPKRVYTVYFQLSPDSSSVLLGYSLPPSRKDNFDGSSKEFLYLFDVNNFKLQWKKTVTIPIELYNGKPMTAMPRVHMMSINRDNTISLLIKNWGIKNFDFYTVSEENVDIKKELIPLDKDRAEFKSTRSFSLLHSLSKDKTDLLYLDGQGILSYGLSAKGELLSNGKYKYPLDFKTLHLGEKEKKEILKKEKKGKGEIKGFSLISILDKENGGALLVTESQTREQSTSNGQSSAITYKYGNLVLVSLKADGTVEWTKKIPKKQINKSNRSVPFYIGTKCILSKDKKSVYLFYLDAPENLEIAADGVPQEYRSRMMGGFLVLCKINVNNGTYEKHLVADMSDINGSEAIDIEITNIFPTVESDNIFLMEARFNKKDALIKITMKN